MPRREDGARERKENGDAEDEMLISVFLAFGACAALGKNVVAVPGWPKLPLPFSTALISESGNLHISGMQGVDFLSTPVALVPGGIANQTKQTLSNIATVAKAAGASMDDLLACTVLLADMADFKAMNAVYATFFTDGVPPSRVTFQVRRAQRPSRSTNPTQRCSYGPGPSPPSACAVTAPAALAPTPRRPSPGARSSRSSAPARSPREV